MKQLLLMTMFLSFVAFGATQDEKIRTICDKTKSEHHSYNCFENAQNLIAEGVLLEDVFLTVCSINNYNSLHKSYFCMESFVHQFIDRYPFKIIRQGCHLSLAQYASTISLELRNAFTCYRKSLEHVVEEKIGKVQ